MSSIDFLSLLSKVIRPIVNHCFWISELLSGIGETGLLIWSQNRPELPNNHWSDKWSAQKIGFGQRYSHSGLRAVLGNPDQS